MLIANAVMSIVFSPPAILFITYRGCVKLSLTPKTLPAYLWIISSLKATGLSANLAGKKGKTSARADG
ncbi:hypothetical protein [Mucilaginibacter puniceus]